MLEIFDLFADGDLQSWSYGYGAMARGSAIRTAQDCPARILVLEPRLPPMATMGSGFNEDQTILLHESQDNISGLTAAFGK